ncbi:hypothetical protein OIV83_000208 [Microbotryomycetes sp. JL201]|nr:hypothetical protein OIV83_000208 [Microbotryomycetes sp. JL201]
MLLGTRLYRALLREARALLDDRARCGATKTAYTRELMRPYTLRGYYKASIVVKQANKLLRQLQAANDGYGHAIERTLAVAFGQRGPAKHELLQPFVRPNPAFTTHKFSPALAALVTSPIATSAARAATLDNLKTPPSLPPRAFPDTEEARLLGPLTPQRTKAIRRRYWNMQTAKLAAPIAVNISRSDKQPVDDPLDVLAAAGLQRIDLERGHVRLSELERKASVTANHMPRLPRRAANRRDSRHSIGTAPRSKMSKDDSDRRVFPPSVHNTKWSRPHTITSRLMRRQYQRLLERSPVVTVQDGRASASPAGLARDATKPFKIPGINISVGTSTKHRGKNMPVLREDELQWFQ